jgi:hypothetical protein
VILLSYYWQILGHDLKIVDVSVLQNASYKVIAQFVQMKTRTATDCVVSHGVSI